MFFRLRLQQAINPGRTQSPITAAINAQLGSTALESTRPQPPSSVVGVGAGFGLTLNPNGHFGVPFTARAGYQSVTGSSVLDPTNMNIFNASLCSGLRFDSAPSANLAFVASADICAGLSYVDGQASNTSRAVNVSASGLGYNLEGGVFAGARLRDFTLSAGTLMQRIFVPDAYTVRGVNGDYASNTPLGSLWSLNLSYSPSSSGPVYSRRPEDGCDEGMTRLSPDDFNTEVSRRMTQNSQLRSEIDTLLNTPHPALANRSPLSIIQAAAALAYPDTGNGVDRSASAQEGRRLQREEFVTRYQTSSVSEVINLSVGSFPEGQDSRPAAEVRNDPTYNARVHEVCTRREQVLEELNNEQDQLVALKSTLQIENLQNLQQVIAQVRNSPARSSNTISITSGEGLRMFSLERALIFTPNRGTAEDYRAIHNLVEALRADPNYRNMSDTVRARTLQQNLASNRNLANLFLMRERNGSPRLLQQLPSVTPDISSQINGGRVYVIEGHSTNNTNQTGFRAAIIGELLVAVSGTDRNAYRIRVITEPAGSTRGMNSTARALLNNYVQLNNNCATETDTPACTANFNPDTALRTLPRAEHRRGGGSNSGAAQNTVVQTAPTVPPLAPPVTTSTPAEFTPAARPATPAAQQQTTPRDAGVARALGESK